LFFREIIAARATLLMSVLLSLMLGGSLGFIAMKATNRLIGLRDNPFVGAGTGAVMGLVVAIFFYGYIDISDSTGIEIALNGIAIIYSSTIGGRIGAVVFALLGAVAVIRERSMASTQLRENMMNLTQKPSIYTMKKPSDDK